MKILKFLTLLCAGIVSATILATAVAATPTPEPAAKLAYGKSASVDAAGVIIYVISVTNSGNLDSDSQTMQDVLPAGIEWNVAADTWGCSIDASPFLPGRAVLSCDPAIVEKRHLNAAEDDFENGTISVSVYGGAEACGLYSNTARFNAGAISRTAAVSIPCPEAPTPVPTATLSPTATPSPVLPTTTAAISFTPTPQPAVTPIRVAPGPPSTGNTVASVPEGEGLALTVAWVLTGLIGLGGITWAAWRGIR